MPQRDYSDFLGQQKKRRDLFEAMWAQSQGKPVRNVWEGLGNLGATLTYAYMADKKGDQVKEEEDAARKRYAGLVGALLGSNGQPSLVTAVQPPSPTPDPTVTQRPLSGGMGYTEAIQQLETGGLANPDKAISPKGAAGRMQVMPDTAREVAASIPGPMGTLGRMASDSQVQAALSVPQIGQKAGDTYYAQMLAKYNDPVLAAAAYNAGPGRVDEALAASGGDINAFIAALPQETQAYLLGNAQRPGFIQMTGSPNGAGTNMTMPSPGGTSTPPAGAAPGAVVSSPPAPATAATMGMPEQVIALLNDPATFELGQELANMLIAQKMQGGGQPAVTEVDGVLYQYDPRNPAGTMQPITQPKQGGGPFQGTSMDAQVNNILLQGDPNSPEYRAAWNIASQPKITVDPVSGTLTTIAPDMSAYRPPAGGGGMPAPTGAPPPAAGGGTAPPPGTGTTMSVGGTTVTQTPGLVARPTESQAKAMGFADRLASANELLTANEAAGLNWADQQMNSLPMGLGNFLVPEEFQRYDQARRDFINAQLRRESGAVISAEEFDNANKQYFPQPGDKPEVLEQKRKAREIAIQAMQRDAGPAYTGGAAPAPGAGLPPPPPGFVPVQ